jgi:hypothetical protein
MTNYKNPGSAQYLHSLLRVAARFHPQKDCAPVAQRHPYSRENLKGFELLSTWDKLRVLTASLIRLQARGARKWPQL